MNTIWLDMDGVLVDFISGAATRFGYEISSGDDATAWRRMGCDTPEFWKRVETAGASFWSDLPDFETTGTLIDWARKNSGTLGICTAAPKHSSPEGIKLCQLGKIEWLHRHALGELPVMFTRDKQLLADQHSLLIDDLPNNCSNFIRHGGRALLYPRTWNAGNPDIGYFDPRKLA